MAAKKYKRKNIKKQRKVLLLCITIVFVGDVYVFSQLFEYYTLLRTKESVQNFYYSQQSPRDDLSNTLAVDDDPPPISPVPEALMGTLQENPVVTPAFSEPMASTFPTEPSTEYIDTIQSEFRDLYEKNSDIVGWLKVSDFVDMPLVYRDNTFYLNHNYNGQESYAGWLFLDERNHPDLNDSCNLIYGHNLRSGEMFGQLHKFRYPGYLKRFPFIEVQPITEEKPRKYVIFSVCDISVNPDSSHFFEITNFTFYSPEEKQRFIDGLLKRSIHDLPITATPDDQIILLVTCSYNYRDGRLLIAARELAPEEHTEDIQALFPSE